MDFSTVMMFLCVAYILVYAGMILYDLFFSKEIGEASPRMEEEEIDISDEVLAFHPIEVSKEVSQMSAYSSPAADVAQMTGGIDFKGVKIALEDLAAKGEKSGFAEVMDCWRIHDQAA